MRTLNSLMLACVLAFFTAPQLFAGTFTYTSGTRYVYSPTATIAGLNVGSVAGNPSAPINGDIWYNSTANTLNARINGATVSLGAGGGGSSTWGGITGTLSDQTDLNNALNGKLAASSNLSDVANPVIALTNLTGEVTPNYIFAGPDGGGNDNPSFRAMALGDLPSGTATETWVQSNFSGSTNLITLGSVNTGTWQASAIQPAYGGTGLTALGTAGQVLATSAGGTMEWISAPLLGTAQTWTAQQTFSAAPAVSRTNLSGGTTLSVGSYYYDSLSASRTLTFSGTPAEGQSIGLKLTVTNAPTLTIPSCKRAGEANSAITALALYPGVHTLVWTYVGAEWVLSDSAGVLNKLDATAAPTASDDSADGYGLGSVWVDVTNDVTYVAVDVTAGAAVWRLSGNAVTGTGSTVLADSPTLTGNPVAPTPAENDNDTSIATTAYVQTEISGLGGGSGATISSFQQNVFLWEEFLMEGSLPTSGVGQLGLVRAVSGTGASITGSSLDVQTAPGVGQLTTGTTITGYSTLNSNVTGTRLGGGVYKLEARIYMPALVDGTDSGTVRFGFIDSTTGTDGTDGVFFRFSNANANWIMVARSNSTETATASTSAPSAVTWYKLRIEVNAAASSVEYFVNGSSIGTVTTNIPTATVRYCGPGISIVKSAGTTARTLLVDYMGLEINLTASR